MTDDGFDMLWVGGNKFLVGKRLADAVRAEIAHLKASPAPELLAELEAARRVFFAIEKYIMMPTQDDNGLAVDDGAEWEAIIEALNEWQKARGEG